ncbi:MAG: leucine-rich repeat domain-containing protein [Treponema sp.]|nr:leucine-rich repeat domain-containing protein [Treponema sp.]
MKKLVAVFLVLFSLGLSLAAQTTGVTSSSGSSEIGQIETFSWEEVPKARKYGVDIERLNEKGKWVKFYSKEIRKTSIEVELPPGSYRIAISTFNILGKKTASDWTNFYVLDEGTPYLFDNYYKKPSDWKVPVLYIDYKGKDLQSVPGSKNFITAEKGFDDNTFFIKGKHLSSPDLKFYLVPSDKALDGGKEYIPFYTDRKEVPLTVVKKDAVKGGVYVSYDKKLLYSGYYSLEARNGMSKDSLGILVLADRPLSIAPFNFEQDLRYKVNALNADGSSEIRFAVIGKGFDSNTKFSLVPTDTAGIDYPYAINKDRSIVAINLKDKVSVNEDGTVRLEFTCSARDIKTGYYYIQADNDNKETAHALILIKMPLLKESDVIINKIATKYNKRSKKLDFTVKGENLDKAKAITLVSEYSLENGGNVKIPLKISKSAIPGTKFVTALDPGSVIFGDYMVLIETASGVVREFFTIDKHFKARIISMNDIKADKKFLMPEGDGTEEIDFTSDAPAKVTFVDGETTVTAKKPSLFPYIRFSAASTKTAVNEHGLDFDLRFEQDIFNNGWVGLGLGVKSNRCGFFDSTYTVDGSTVHIEEQILPDFGIELHTKFLISKDMFCPYLGGAVGYNLVNPATGLEFSNLFSKIGDDGFINAGDFYAIGYIGVTLIEILDFRFNFEFHNLLKDSEFNYMRSNFALGVRMPIRRSVYTRKVVTQGAVVTKNGEVRGEDYNNLSKLTFLEFDEGVTEVSGFEGYNAIQKLSFPSTLETIGDRAFKNCSNLESVRIFGNGLTYIGDEAFAGDTSTLAISIPASVTYIGKDAFAGWTDGQVITLMWNADDKVKRDLTGLKDTGATILYLDGTPAEGFAYKTSFEDEKNWKSFSGISYTRGTMSYKEAYHTAIHLKGFVHDTDEAEAAKLTNSKLAEAIKDKSKVKFKVYGDGNKYMFYVKTSGDGYFATEFNTKDKGFTEVTIPLKSLTKREYSKQKKYDGSDIVFAQVIPVGKEGRVPACTAYFFDFEVE